MVVNHIDRHSIRMNIIFFFYSPYIVMVSDNDYFKTALHRDRAGVSTLLKFKRSESLLTSNQDILHLRFVQGAFLVDFYFLLRSSIGSPGLLIVYSQLTSGCQIFLIRHWAHLV
eukprot:TRINITY_DN4689_c2_g1_i1.p1 TRINITY_DN4689_c2_g1~~TRINITY_DN4689_c2_g1_i1.p1  ORF type:complete len:114 (-),score=2.75 TRINITY_DN4689_c2_g1_i1:97-438(-)